MRFLLAFVIGLSAALIVTVIPVLIWDSQYRAMWLPGHRSGSGAVAHLSALVGLAALAAALALPVAYVSTKGLRKPWPTKSLILGILSGICLGVVLDGLCVYAVHHGWD